MNSMFLKGLMVSLFSLIVFVNTACGEKDDPNHPSKATMEQLNKIALDELASAFNGKKASDFPKEWPDILYTATVTWAGNISNGLLDELNCYSDKMGDGDVFDQDVFNKYKNNIYDTEQVFFKGNIQKEYQDLKHESAFEVEEDLQSFCGVSMKARVGNATYPSRELLSSFFMYAATQELLRQKY